MRRFESRIGSSNKFWSIDQARSSFTVCYGKLNTKGREQIKEFDSEAEAAQAAEKLIASKVKKGYVEVDDADTPRAKSAPVPKAQDVSAVGSDDSTPDESTPASAEAVDYSKPFIEWTPELRKRVLPQRGDAPPKRRRTAIKIEKILAPGVVANKKHTSQWKRGAELAKPKEVNLLERVRTRLRGHEPTEFDAQLETATMLVCAHFAWWGAKRRELSERFVLYWAQNYGAQAAAEALFGTLSMHFHSRAKREDAFGLGIGSRGQTSAGILRVTQPWEALRRVLAFCDDESFAKARAWLLKAAEDSQGETLAESRVAFVLPGERALRDRLWALKKRDVASVSDAEEAAHALARRDYGSPYILTMFRRVGIDALPALLKRRPNTGDAGQQRDWVRGMSVVIGDEPATAMLQYVGTKSLRALLGTYFERHPTLALRVVPEVLKTLKKKAEKQAAKAILESARGALAASSTTPGRTPTARVTPSSQLVRLQRPPQQLLASQARSVDADSPRGC